MRHRFPFGEGGSPFFGRGNVKFIILELLKEKPKHGYEIMKDIETKFGGFYSPSPGSIYPTLQMLEDQSYVTSYPEDGKKVYQITEAGRTFMEENKEAIEKMDKRLKRSSIPLFHRDMRRLGREIHDLASTVFRDVRHGRYHSPEQLQKVQEVLARAREEIENVLAD